MHLKSKALNLTPMMPNLTKTEKLAKHCAKFMRKALGSAYVLKRIFTKRSANQKRINLAPTLAFLSLILHPTKRKYRRIKPNAEYVRDVFVRDKRDIFGADIGH